MLFIHANNRVLLLWAPIDACCDLLTCEREGQALQNFSLLKGKADFESIVVLLIKSLHFRPLGTIGFTPSCVIKKYNCEDAKAQVVHLQNIYAVLADWGVPNTDRLNTTIGVSVYLTPCGISTCPKTEAELWDCIICILKTLVVSWFCSCWIILLTKTHARPFTKSQCFIVMYGGPILSKVLMNPTSGSSLIGRMRQGVLPNVNLVSPCLTTLHTFERITMVPKLTFGQLGTWSLHLKLLTSEDFKNFGESICEQLNILTAQLVLEYMCKGDQSRYFVPKKSLYYAETVGSRNWTLHLYCFQSDC